MTPSPMAHFAINVDGTKAFCPEVFGRGFTSGGWPELFHIDTGTKEPDHPVGSLQRRRAIVEGRPSHWFKCTIAVSDLEAFTSADKAAGGRIVMDPYSIPDVGTLNFFRGHGVKHRGSHALRPDHQVLEVASPQRTLGIRRITSR